MKNRLIYGVVLLALVAWTIPAIADEQSGAAIAEAPELDWLKLDAALKTADREGKHIMVDVYTDWCTWCKKLDRDTYGDPAVRQVLAESYISVKLKGDSDAPLNVKGQPKKEGDRTMVQFVPTEQPVTTERQLTRGAFRVTGFPTIMFLAADGKVITSLPGYKDAVAFRNILNFIKDDLYEVMTYQDYLKSLENATTEGGKS